MHRKQNGREGKGYRVRRDVSALPNYYTARASTSVFWCHSAWKSY